MNDASSAILTATAFRNEFQPVGFLIDLNLSGFVFRVAGLLFRLDATLSIETSLTCSTRSTNFVSSQNYPMYIKQRTSCFRDFRERNAVSNITISVIPQEPV